MLRSPRFSPGVSKLMIKLSPRKPQSSQLVRDHGPVDARMVVPLPRIADSHPNPAILTRTRQWPLSARCAISGHSVYWGHGFAPGLGWYHILGQNTLVTVTQDPCQIVGRERTSNPAKTEIMMLSHILDFWKTGLLAIHPGTLRVRCFVPSDVIRNYDRKVASFPESDIPDRDNLRTYYERCVWVNMTTCLPRIVLTLPSATKDESTFYGTVEASIKKTHDSGVADATSEEYCTQKCLLGLKHGGLLDEACPNYASHLGLRIAKDSSHKLDDQSFTFLIQKQLKIDQSLFCHQPTVLVKGHHAEFFKITLAGFGYTFCAKGVAVSDQHRLINEYIMYQKMSDVQGECIPVCLGLFALQRPFGSQNISGLEITHMLLMSNAGGCVEGENAKDALWYLPSEEKLKLESERTMRDIRDTGVDRHDQRKKHLYWYSERNRVFYIDFEKNSPIPGTEIKDTDGSQSEENKTPREKEIDRSEPDWDGI